MTQKTLNGIELGVVTLLSAGVDYVVDKTIINAVKPKTIPEKILTGVGIVGVDLACDYGIYRFVHGLLYPSDAKKYEMLVRENIKAIETCNEVSKVMAEYEVKVYDAVGDIYRNMMEGTTNG